MGRYLDTIEQFEPKFSRDVAADLPWACRYCERPLVIEDIALSADRTRILTCWHCDACETSGITPDVVREPPTSVTLGHICTLFPPEEEPLSESARYEQPEIFEEW